MRTRCSAAADGIEPRDAEVVIIVTAPAKGDRGLRGSERHVAKKAGVWGPGFAPPPIPSHPISSPSVPGAPVLPWKVKRLFFVTG